MIDNDAADDVNRSDLASCHLCSRCIRHNVDCPIESHFPTTECVEYRAKENSHGLA